MTDSIRVFDPGWRALDQNGDLVPGALIKFYNAGTKTPRAVYSNSGLSTSLSDTVTCNASGAPADSGGTLVLIYTGTTAYKVEIYDSGGALVPGMTFDNVSGALDTSVFDVTATVAWEVVPISATGTIPSGNLGKLENVNPTAGQVARTLPTAASAGLGGYIWLRHDGTANAVLALSQGSDLIHTRGDLGGRQCVTLWKKGDAVLFISDEVDWHAQFTPEIPRETVQAIQTAPPASPVAGDAYIITGSPTGAWSTFAANDVVTADGNAGWYRQRPFTDCGWVAYNAGTSSYVRYIGSGWRTDPASDTYPGLVQYALQADLEQGKSNVLAVTPGRQHFHPGMAKAWVRFTGVTTAAIVTSYNVSSVTRTGAGSYTIAFTVAFSSENPAMSGAGKSNSGNPGFLTEVTPGASSYAIQFRTVTGAGSGLEDAASLNAVFHGDI